jgi:hypothetical protein
MELILHHISWSIATNGLWTIYINGELFNNTTSRTIANVVWHNFYIGRTVGPTIPATFFTGKIKDFRFCSKVLTQEEVSILATNYFTDNDLRRTNYPIIKNESYKSELPEPVIGMDLTPNLWCKFDTGALLTNDGTDVITLVNNGTATNSGVAVRGNNSISLNGTNQTLSGSIEGIANNSFSVSAWIYPKTGARFKGIVLTIGTEYDTYKTIFLGLGGNVLNSYTFGIYATDSYSSTAYAGDVNNWVHITWVYNSNTREKMIHRNGIKIQISNAISPSPLIPNTNFLIGGVNTTTFSFHGYIDDLRVYTGNVLSQTQINELYAGNPYYNLPTALTRYNTDPTNTQYQFEVVDEEQKLINRY